MERENFSDGFSLIELAIVLTIIGIVGGLSVPLISQQINRSREKVSFKHHDQIMRSLAAYVLRENKLPYAANPGARGEKFGKSDTLEKGIVPFKTLGLDESIAKDGHKNYITYIVDKNLCNTNVLMDKEEGKGIENLGSGGGIGHVSGGLGRRLEQKIFCEIPKSPFKIKTPRGLEDNKAIILISHGQGGHGSFMCNGRKDQKKTSISGKNENLNANAMVGSEFTFQKHSYSTNKQNLFRHRIIATTRDNLMAIYAQYPCRKG